MSEWRRILNCLSWRAGGSESKYESEGGQGMTSILSSIRGSFLSRQEIDEDPKTFHMPQPLPHFAQGAATGFASKTISVGELELAQVSTLEKIGSNETGVTFCKPVNLPEGFSCLGHYCQANDRCLSGWLLVARVVVGGAGDTESLRALKHPVGYRLVCSSNMGFIWLPIAPKGYAAMGYIVSTTKESPDLEEVMCVRSDLTETCQISSCIFSQGKMRPFSVWNMKPVEVGITAKGIAVGAFYYNDTTMLEESIPIRCLKNIDPSFTKAMPSLNQVHTLISHYGPTVFFHPEENYLPSSVNWFFSQGALLYTKGNPPLSEVIKGDGANLPAGGKSDGEYWIDLPEGGGAEGVKKGDLSSAEVYVQVKPMLGGTFTDLAMWVYCPFNGASTAKVGIMNLSLGKIGEHVSDWEHFTLRISNFTGELWKIYYGQHRSGIWVDTSELEFVSGSKAAVYSSKHGHAMYPHPGLVLQGDSRLGVGIRNDTARSKFSLDSSSKYMIISAEYLQEKGPKEPAWLQYAREWGPNVQYDSRAELERIMGILPSKLRSALLQLLKKLPNELSGEHGPEGPKQKDYWLGDER